jgi:cell division protein FtsW
MTVKSKTRQPNSFGHPAFLFVAPGARRSVAGLEGRNSQVAPAAMRVMVRRLFGSISPDAAFLAAIVLFLVGFGLVMVLSASAITAYVTTNNAFSVFSRQALCAGIGIPVMFIAARLPARFWKRWAVPALLGTFGLQILVLATPLGVQVGGNRNWLQLGSLPALQPSEVIKVAIAVWLGLFLTRREGQIGQWREALLPAALVSAAAMALVVVGGDLGSTLIMVGMVLSALLVGGARSKHLLVLVMTDAGLALILALSRPSRVTRIMATLNPSAADPLGAGWQVQNGFQAMARGGMFGVGLGNSDAKWSWLPAADTDFIFAIIGEELGLIGTILTVVLFAVLAILLLRIIHGSQDQFSRVVTAAIMAWISGQALVNIAVVLGLLPGIGVPLPFISSGGTSLITCLLGIGIVLSLTDHNLKTGPSAGASNRTLGSSEMIQPRTSTPSKTSRERLFQRPR